MATILLIGSCKKDDYDNSPIVTQAFSLDTFTKITLSIDGTVRIIKGDIQNIKVTGPQETVNNIIQKVNSQKWNISLPSEYKKKYDNLEITITSNLITGLSNSSSGNIISEDTLSLSTIESSGSGNIDIKTKSTTLASTFSGNGNINISGKANIFEHVTTGSGNFIGFNFETINTVFRVAGSGNSEIFTKSNLDVTISGSGDIYYKGTPTIIQDITGSGSLINAN